MKMFASHNILKCLAIAATVACCCSSARATEKTVAAAKTESVIPRSVFANDPNVGRDPFFPGSTRRKDVIPRAVVTTTNAAPVHSIASDLLKLKGISGTKDQPLALINGSTMAPGEIADIKCYGGQIVKLRCREIRHQSVLIELLHGGEVRELKLREGI